MAVLTMAQKSAPFGVSESPAATPADTQPAQSNPATAVPVPLPDSASAVVADPLDLTVGEWPGLHLDWFDSLWTQTDTTWPEILDRHLG